jgi:membrane fusion protein, multidrug efflux system
MRQVLILLGVLALGGGLFYLGYQPRQEKKASVQAATAEAGMVRVRVVNAQPAKNEDALELPGTLDSRKESPIFARAEGYIKTRLVGFGDRVRQGQLLVEIDSPEIERQFQLAQARLKQAEATVAQAEAQKQQATANLKIAEATNLRWKQLVKEGVISKQEGEEKLATQEARSADLVAADANITVIKESIRAQEAEVARLAEIRSFQRVVAPFDGVITARSCEVGNLITPGALAAGLQLFKIAQVSNLRVLIDLPEVYVPRVAVNQPAELRSQTFPGEVFNGFVSRISNELDRTSRTMTIEVLVEDKKDRLRPGMFTQVRLVGTRRTPALVVPGDAIVTRPDGSYLAIVRPGNKVKMQKVNLGRDFGAESEVLQGLEPGDNIILSPGDDVREGVSVQMVK